MSRLSRVQELQTATKQYVAAEKKRIEDEVSVLEAVLDGRTGGRGVQRVGQEAVSAVAKANLAAYLQG